MPAGIDALSHRIYFAEFNYFLRSPLLRMNSMSHLGFRIVMSGQDWEKRKRA
jgi:hypothetical protein